mgnify:CR=1 FL=1|jgi:hypothetical protein
MKITLDLKTLVTLGGILAMLSGFVYTTTLRLNNIEEQVDSLEVHLHAIERYNQRKARKGQQKK